MHPLPDALEATVIIGSPELRQPRGFDVDVAEDGTGVLSLSERVLAQLPNAAPAAAQLRSNIPRQVCRSLSAAGTHETRTVR